MGNIYVQNVIIATVSPLLPTMMAWGFMRSMHPTRPLGSSERRLLGYGLAFFIAMGYTLMVGPLFLRWPRWVWFTLIAAEGILIFYIAWRRSHLKQPGAPAATEPKVPYLGAGLPTVTLLVCLVGSVVEWDLVAGRSGRLWVAFLWTAGVVASIWLARKYRHAAVVAALRTFIALAVIGAIAERDAAAVIIAGGAGAVLVVLQKLWRKPQPPFVDLAALSSESEADSKSSHVGIRRN
jgi:hypothetical protein